MNYILFFPFPLVVPDISYRDGRRCLSLLFSSTLAEQYLCGVHLGIWDLDLGLGKGYSLILHKRDPGRVCGRDGMGWDGMGLLGWNDEIFRRHDDVI